jgi:hypothetical protein
MRPPGRSAARSAILGLVTAAALLASACSARPAQVVPPQNGPGQTMPPVAVSRSSITSVITLDGIVQATPSYAVVAPTKGRLSTRSGYGAGKKVKAGDRIGYVGKQPLRVLVTGVLGPWSVPDGMDVDARVPVASVRFGGFGVTAKLPPQWAYRMNSNPLGAKTQITGGPGPTTCRLVLPATDRTTSPDPAPGGVPLAVLCLLPRGTKTVSGLSAIVAVRTVERSNVLTLPVETVAGNDTTGQVAKIVNGVPVVTDVKLGATDGVSIEIVSGLAEGDQVSPYGPNLRVPVADQ